MPTSSMRGSTTSPTTTSGRGVILIGHSQGAGVLTQLIKNEIDPNPVLRDRLVSAMLLGTSLQVPVGQDVGGDFENVPLCRKHHQTGCAISYGSFRSDGSAAGEQLLRRVAPRRLEGRVHQPGRARGRHAARCIPICPTDGRRCRSSRPPIPWVDPSRGVTITTPFVTLPDFLDADCAEHNGFPSWRSR